jgi:hypothetical protein
MITGLCDMVQFTSLSELINVLGVDGRGGAGTAVASDDQVVVVRWPPTRATSPGAPPAT